MNKFGKRVFQDGLFIFIPTNCSGDVAVAYQMTSQVINSDVILARGGGGGFRAITNVRSSLWLYCCTPTYQSLSKTVSVTTPNMYTFVHISLPQRNVGLHEKIINNSANTLTNAMNLVFVPMLAVSMNMICCFCYDWGSLLWCQIHAHLYHWGYQGRFCNML